MPEQKVKAKFIGPMLLLRTDKLTEGAECRYEVKLDGYRALAIKTAGRVQLRSRNDNDLSAGDLGPVKALAPMPDETVIDREVVALDEAGKPSFNALQNAGSAGAVARLRVRYPHPGWRNVIGRAFMNRGEGWRRSFSGTAKRETTCGESDSAFPVSGGTRPGRLKLRRVRDQRLSFLSSHPFNLPTTGLIRKSGLPDAYPSSHGY